MNTNLFEDFKEKIESQLKQAETDIKKEKESVLFGIECMMEGAVDKIELASLNRQYDMAEKQFEEELIHHRRKTVKGFINELGILTKHIKKVYSKELNNK